VKNTLTLWEIFAMNRVMRKIKRWSKRSKLLAVNDDGLEKWLDSLGILHRVKGGEAHCFVCKEKIDIDRIQMVSQVEGEIVIICDKPECMYHFTQEYGKA